MSLVDHAALAAAAKSIGEGIAKERGAEVVETEAAPTEETTQEDLGTSEVAESAEDQEQALDAQSEPEAEDAETVDDETTASDETTEPDIYTLEDLMGANVRIDLGDGDVIDPADLRDRSMKDADYTRKTQSVARAAEVYAQKVQGYEALEQELGAELDQSVKAVGSRMAALEQQYNAIDWTELQEEDPQKAQAKHERMQREYQGLLQQKSDFDTSVQRAHQRHRQRREYMMGVEGKALQKATNLPDEKLAPYVTAARNYAVESLGFAPVEAGEIIDHRVLMALNKMITLEQKVGKLPAAKAKLSKIPTIKARKARGSGTDEAKRVASSLQARINGTDPKDRIAAAAELVKRGAFR